MKRAKSPPRFATRCRRRPKTRRAPCRTRDDALVTVQMRLGAGAAEKPRVGRAGWALVLFTQLSFSAFAESMASTAQRAPDDSPDDPPDAQSVRAMRLCDQLCRAGVWLRACANFDPALFGARAPRSQRAVHTHRAPPHAHTATRWLHRGARAVDHACVCASLCVCVRAISHCAQTKKPRAKHPCCAAGLRDVKCGGTTCEAYEFVVAHYRIRASGLASAEGGGGAPAGTDRDAAEPRLHVCTKHLQAAVEHKYPTPFRGAPVVDRRQLLGSYACALRCCSRQVPVFLFCTVHFNVRVNAEHCVRAFQCSYVVHGGRCTPACTSHCRVHIRARVTSAPCRCARSRTCCATGPPLSSLIARVVCVGVRMNVRAELPPCAPCPSPCPPRPAPQLRMTTPAVYVQPLTPCRTLSTRLERRSATYCGPSSP